ncbi:MAG: TIGR02300 family protein [Pseudomonadota bacterium]|nr:TIGR02300 family protein [Pseudomonadota bacterium]
MNFGFDSHPRTWQRLRLNFKFFMETDLAKPEWGLKRTCLNCSTRFYDMQRHPIICPSCGTEFDPLALVRPRRARAAAAHTKSKAEEKPVPEEAAAEDDGLLVDEGDDVMDVGSDLDLSEDADGDILAHDDDEPDLDDDPDVSESLETAKDDGEDNVA